MYPADSNAAVFSSDNGCRLISFIQRQLLNFSRYWSRTGVSQLKLHVKVTQGQGYCDISKHYLSQFTVCRCTPSICVFVASFIIEYSLRKLRVENPVVKRKFLLLTLRFLSRFSILIIICKKLHAVYTMLYKLRLQNSKYYIFLNYKIKQQSFRGRERVWDVKKAARTHGNYTVINTMELLLFRIEIISHSVTYIIRVNRRNAPKLQQSMSSHSAINTV